MPLQAGDKFGPYEILAPIGAGGMGEVYKARDTRLNRIVAFKRLKDQHAGRFEQEARAIAALNHPNICQIYDVGPGYLVMEYIEGSPLNGPLTTEETLKVAQQIAQALEEAHARGIVHRDLKPGNILVTPKGAIKLLDFGLAKLMATDPEGTQTADGLVMGTAAYMSPEQAQGKPLDARSDVFSFGAVLYEITAGKRAFAGESMLETLNAVVRDEPPALSSPLSSVVKRCLAKQPGQRYQSMADVVAALQQVFAKPAQAQPSIAVLPFANMSRDADDEYFSDGLAEEIINALVKVPGLKVIARTSAFAFKGQNTDIRKIAETLGVSTVLEGSVRRAGNRIRVTAQLITAADGSHLWSERYDREMADVFAVQDEISAAIADALKVKLSLAPDAVRYTPKLDAYEALLKAKYFHWKVTLESMERAKEFYEQAIMLDPQYALAQALYADYLCGRTTVGMSPMREAAPVARALALRALELDPKLPEAHQLLGVLAIGNDFDWAEGERRFALATADDAASAHCHLTRSLYLLYGSGRWEEALAEIERAVRKDPLHLTIRHFRGACLAGVGRYQEAEQQYREVMDISPQYFWPYIFCAGLLLYQGRDAEALGLAKEAYQFSSWYAPSVGIYAGMLVRTGDIEQGHEVAKRLGTGEAYGTPLGWATFYRCTDDVDMSAHWFEKAMEQRDALVASYLQGLIGAPVRASTHWSRLAAMLRLA